MSDKEVQSIAVTSEYGHGEVDNLKHHNRDVDIAAAYADRLSGDDAYSHKEERRLRWKLDLRLVPILWMNVTLGAMDKQSTGTSSKA
jgi:hypothetical protein